MKRSEMKLTRSLPKGHSTLVVDRSKHGEAKTLYDGTNRKEAISIFESAADEAAARWSGWISLLSYTDYANDDASYDLGRDGRWSMCAYVKGSTEAVEKIYCANLKHRSESAALRILRSRSKYPAKSMRLARHDGIMDPCMSRYTVAGHGVVIVFSFEGPSKFAPSDWIR